ncbi:hypothetical protein AAFF_G00179530 [Aldrovandia affinis]|uniref:EGF-like domain-containing protein n=1 Tax=Aldrovandia affinis TaxID=143900 RepID=A0AAD7W6S2_9TELE|nr:hypothetical protein AAFF_G00179530 [Aldrovandia affinis]
MMNHYFSQLLGFLCLFGSSSGNDPCVNHTVVSGPWRNIAFTATQFPGHPLCDFNLTEKWTRFTGIGGDVITETCVHGEGCGSHQCAFMGFTHPQLGEGIKEGGLHYRWLSFCNHGNIKGLQVLACSGGYYVYFIPILPCSTTIAIRHRNCSLTFCGPRTECNSDGGCVCSSGYRLPVDILPTNDSYDCADIDDCLEDSNICGPNADCNNTVGAHTCTCLQGYNVSSLDYIASTSNPCEDIDECVEDPTICGPNATCTNNIGAHTCACHQGYHVLPEGSIASASNPCQDIDECVEDSTICGPNATCTNTPGSHTCTCLQGYQVSSLASITSASNPCQEIDECVENSTICGPPNAKCTNSPGAYTCACPHGYHVISSDSIVSTCQDVDECSEIACGSNTVCYNTAGGYYCSCQDSYISSTGVNWEFGVTLCESAQEHLDSLTPPEGQSPEIFFLNKLSQELENNPDIILPVGGEQVPQVIFPRCHIPSFLFSHDRCRTGLSLGERVGGGLWIDFLETTEEGRRAALSGRWRRGGSSGRLPAPCCQTKPQRMKEGEVATNEDQYCPQEFRVLDLDLHCLGVLPSLFLHALDLDPHGFFMSSLLLLTAGEELRNQSL